MGGCSTGSGTFGKDRIDIKNMNKEVDSGLFNFIFNRVLLINDHVNDEVNDHQRSGWLEFLDIGRKNKSTPVLQTLHLQPGAMHPVCMARNLKNRGRCYKC